MPDDNKIVIELEVQVKQLQKDLSTAQKDITKFSKGAAKGSEAILEVLKEMKVDLKTIAKSYQVIGAAADRAARTQSEGARKAAKEQKKLNDELQRTIALMGGGSASGGGGGGGGRARGKGGFLSGLKEGSGYSNLAQHKITRYGVGSALGGGIVGGISKIGGFMLGGMQKAHGAYMQYGAARYGMTGLGSPAQLNQMRRTGASGVSLGFSPTQTAQMAPGVASATGNLGATGVAQQLALAGGFGPGRAGEAISYMGTMRQAGAQFGGAGNLKDRQKDLSKTIALGMESGLEKARLPEFFSGVGSLVQSQFSTAAGDVDSGAIAKQLAMLGAGGSGFQGARGAQVMGKLDSMIRQPGGGEAGQAMVLQSMGFGKPGGKSSYYGALKQQQQGIRDPENLKKVMNEVYGQFGVASAGGKDKRNEEANMAMSTMSGLSLEQVEKLQDIKVSNLDNAEKQEKINKILEEAQPLEVQALKVSKEGFAGIQKHIAGMEARWIKLGSENADIFMKIEKYQMKALEYLVEWLPKIGGLMGELYSTMSSWVETDVLGDPTKNYTEFLARLEEVQKSLGLKDVGKMTVEEREQYRKDQLRVEKTKLDIIQKERKKGVQGVGGILGQFQMPDVEGFKQVVGKEQDQRAKVREIEAVAAAEREITERYKLEGKPGLAARRLLGNAAQVARGEGQIGSKVLMKTEEQLEEEQGYRRGKKTSQEHWEKGTRGYGPTVRTQRVGGARKKLQKGQRGAAEET